MALTDEMAPCFSAGQSDGTGCVMWHHAEAVVPVPPGKFWIGRHCGQLLNRASSGRNNPWSACLVWTSDQQEVLSRDLDHPLSAAKVYKPSCGFLVGMAKRAGKAKAAAAKAKAAAAKAKGGSGSSSSSPLLGRLILLGIAHRWLKLILLTLPVHSWHCSHSTLKEVPHGHRFIDKINHDRIYIYIRVYIRKWMYIPPWI